MSYNWESCPTECHDFVIRLVQNMKKVVKNKAIGFYLHGSLAMGGFNPNRSDIDIIVVTNIELTMHEKRELAIYLLKQSNRPYPVELSFMNIMQLTNWQHPSPFDFHFSEAWRERYEVELTNNRQDLLSTDGWTDPDLAAHLTIINKRGICLDGKPIKEVFLTIPLEDYLSSIMADYKDCIANIHDDPVYCTLNILRVLWYVKEGIISSKQEAGEWGLIALPGEFTKTIQQSINTYSDSEVEVPFDESALSNFREYIKKEIRKKIS